MTIRELTSDEIEALVGTRHPGTGMEYPPNGLQPYYQWLLRTLHLLAEASASALRVAPDAESPTTVTIAPGRATIRGTAVSFAGGSFDLAPYNNATAFIWLEEAGGVAAVATGASSSGWPAAAHLKLAEVTLSGGQITSVVDRRWDAVLCGTGTFASATHDHGNAAGAGLVAAATTIARGAVRQAAADSDTAALIDSSGGFSQSAEIAEVGITVDEPSPDPYSPAALRDDLCSTTIPSLQTDLESVRDAVATLAACCNTIVVDLNDLRAKLRSAGILAS